MKTILVPTDFSKNALNAVKYASAYAEATSSKIILFHSYENPTREFEVPFSNIHYGPTQARQAAEIQMKKMAAPLVKKFPAVKFKWIVQPGNGADSIIDYVKQNNIELIIMGTTGQGAIARTFIGSTTSAVLTNSSCHILAIPPKAKFKNIKRIAVGTDLEKDNLSTAEESIYFAKQFKAEIMFVYVEDLEILNANKTLQSAVEKLRKKTAYGIISFYVCQDLNVCGGLDSFIKDYKPDVLSMSTHGRKFPETIWKTSWTDKMSNHITIPLLVLHTKKNTVIKRAVKQKKLIHN